jgi:hypothetical protein
MVEVDDMELGEVQLGFIQLQILLLGKQEIQQMLEITH